MNFPFSYTGELVFYKPDNFDREAFLSQIMGEVVDCEYYNSVLIFSAPFSLTKMPVKIKLFVTDGNTTIHCKYTISLFEGNILLVLSVLFAAFFFYHHAIFYASISLIAGFIFYVSNLSKASNSVKTLIYNQIGGYADASTAALWKQQKQWLKNENLCAACGEPKNSYSHKCINCGLYFHKNAPQINRVSTSLSGKSEVIYEVTKDKKCEK